MADLAVNLLVTAGLSVAMGVSEAPSVLGDPYEEWGDNFLPREDNIPDFTVESSRLHSNGVLGLEPGVRLGKWQLSAPVELSWLDWRTESVTFDWLIPTHTDTALYRFKDPSLGLSAGRWIGPRFRPWLGVSAFRWERQHNTHGGSVDFLGNISTFTVDSKVLDQSWGGHVELGVAMRRPTHEEPLAMVQGLRMSARLTRFSDGYSAAGARLIWAFGADYHPDAGALQGL